MLQQFPLGANDSRIFAVSVDKIFNVVYERQSGLLARFGFGLGFDTGKSDSSCSICSCSFKPSVDTRVSNNPA